MRTMEATNHPVNKCLEMDTNDVCFFFWLSNRSLLELLCVLASDVIFHELFWREIFQKFHDVFSGLWVQAV